MTTSPSHARTVVVPRRPGPVLPLDRQGRNDDLDDLLDEVLPIDVGGPGPFDVVLLVTGAALVAWSLLGAGPSGATAIGLVVMALGLVLPVRALTHAVRGQWEAHRAQRLLANGTALMVADADVRRLVELHADLATRTGDDRGLRAFAAAHAGLLDVADILDGRPAPGPSDRARISRLTEAVTDLRNAYLLGAGRSRSMEAARSDLDGIDRHTTLHRIQETIADL